MSGKILIFGANGQIGRALGELLKDEAILLSRSQADLTRADTLPELIENLEPSAIINAAAYTQVDKAEEEEMLAFAINAQAPGVMAQCAARLDIPFIHYSTDYVFDGSGSEPHKEDKIPNPLNAYGRTKLAGEQRVAASGGKSLIFRTSWVYDAVGKNFFTTMLRLMQEREALRVVSDQFGAPSYAPHLARATLDALKAAKEKPVFPSGIYHMCNGGFTDWCSFARAILIHAETMPLELKTKTITGIDSGEYPTPAKRPLNSRLDSHRLKAILRIDLPDWQAGLAACVEEKLAYLRRTASGSKTH